MSKTIVTHEEILAYHAQFPAGKIGSCITKSLHTPRDIILAYTPGVGTVCQEIVASNDKVYQYTGKGNLVAVISNGTAVLGYGNIGPLAAKPVMEAKAMILKRFAGIDAFDIEIDVTTPEDVIQIIKAIAPTFGALNLEDIKAPECFQIEEALMAQLQIPVMHDDQHATAIVASAALLNALLVANKDISKVQIVFSGAGAGAIATAKLLMVLGAKPDHIVMCDRQGVIRKDREKLDPIKAPFATDRSVHTLHDAVTGADVFIGLSSGDVLMAESVAKMAKDPIVFGLANPVPEISYEAVMSARADVIFATGRGDYPNQVNNLLAFPYIFRGALDVQASAITTAMQQAAVQAIQTLAHEETPVMIRKYYGSNSSFGKEYLLPKPMDSRLLSVVSIAVAQAAIASDVAKKLITDWDAYRGELWERVGHQNA
ncbi:malic enzyme-like NAD(P)-binding protein [Candidatus Cardinium hertigii]|uniref:Malate dehydrogenase n=1 Tax=Candidatus Cardinium hertigii TaxID=247481 RepID=A0A3N2QBA8_9BACT|nr:malic enzyme-like NAD(P)-binding protein [Candidatus Cardinium hertigii]ROT47095.1 malate dehydrogenase [Candidatus Cardinium hertigii]